MPWYRMPDGSPCHINFGGKRNLTAPRPCCGKRADGSVCGQISQYQCDWKLGAGKTCDRWICAEHAQEVAPNKHLCPEHQKTYTDWKAAHENKEATA